MDTLTIIDDRRLYREAIRDYLLARFPRVIVEGRQASDGATNRIDFNGQPLFGYRHDGVSAFEMAAHIARTLFNDFGDDMPTHNAKITRRERDVLAYLIKGCSNKEIARALDLQVVTVKLHVRGICKKLGAANRTQAALMAKEILFE